MTKYEIVSATEEHGLELAANMRLADAREIWAAAKSTPNRSVQTSIKDSDEAWAGLADGRVLCVFGVTPLSLLGRTGIIWMLSTPLLEEHDKAFLRGSRKWIAEVRQRYPVLINAVDVRNTVAIKWLRWLGFELLPPKPHGPFGLPFHGFKMRTYNV